jgi:hypothetical protein
MPLFLSSLGKEPGLSPQSFDIWPVLIAGQNACPSEDVDSVGGYAEVFEAISDPSYDEQAAMWDPGSPSHSPAVRWVRQGHERRNVAARPRNVRGSLIALLQLTITAVVPVSPG